MTDKQIIIDEERMFECVWCKYDFKESEAHFILSENPNECVCSVCITEWADNLLCDFKRKEQECERLKEARKDSRCAWKSLEGTFCPEAQEQLDQLKAENEELKETCDGLLKVQYQLADTNKKLRQCLTEIEKLAIQGNVYCIDYNVDDCEKCIKQNDCKTTLFKQILQICDEVNNER